MPLPPRKKKPGSFALLMGAPPKKPLEGSPEEESSEDPAEADAEGDDPTDPMGDTMDDPMGGDSSDAQIDPEQAALAETLGFSDPEQQQALIDLIKLVTSADPMKSADSGSALPPLPESPY